MKKGPRILLTLCMCAFCVLIGLFIGRNMNGHYVILPANIAESTRSDESVNVDYRIDINTATATQLMALPGIGEVIADRIIAYRTENGPYLSTSDLLNVEGIGEKKLHDIESFIKVGG